MTKSNLDLSRRQVLKGTALSAAAVLTPEILRWDIAIGKEGAPSETLNIAAIGTGMMGRVNIGSAARAGAKIVALCDVDEAQMAPLYKHFPKAAKYQDFRRLLDKENGIDAVIVSTPDHAHAPIAMAAMASGKHVYCEKPLAHTLYEARKMTEAARKHKVATQLGNQGHSYHAIHEFCRVIWSGTIGEVREVHAIQRHFSNSRIDQLGRIDQGQQVPKTLNWDLWLGPAPKRKYHRMYHPGAWRGWRQFGTGSIGDFLCHVVDPVFWALSLGSPQSILAEAPGYDPKKHSETFPRSSTIRFKFPTRGKRPPVNLYWHDGRGNRPKQSEKWPTGGQTIPIPAIGAVVVGDKGVIVYGSHGAKEWHIYPDAIMKEYMGDRKRVPEPRGRGGAPGNLKHVKEWLQACKGWKAAGSNFDYGGPLTELALLGNIASLTPGTELQWDSTHMMFPNQPGSNAYLHFQYRKGWAL